MHRPMKNVFSEAPPAGSQPRPSCAPERNRASASATVSSASSCRSSTVQLVGVGPTGTLRSAHSLKISPLRNQPVHTGRAYPMSASANSSQADPTKSRSASRS